MARRVPVETAPVKSPPVPIQSIDCTVEFLDRRHESKWDEFVIGHPQASPFHLLAWKRTIEDTFNYESQYLLALEGGQIRGVLPLFLVRNRLLGSALISSPFAVYGGVLANSEEAHRALTLRVRELGESLQVGHVELRNAYPEQCLGFASVSHYVTFTQAISPDDKAILESIPRKTRAAVRKSLKEDFSVRTQSRDFAAFEELYSRNLRRLGTPCFPRRYFANLLENFEGKIDIREIALQGRVVAAVLSFYFRDQLLPYYGASDPAFNAHMPNNFMYYELMRWGGENGYKLFDFGRSKSVNSGSYDFKAHWGMEMRELPYEMHLVRRKKMPNFSPNNPVFEWPIKLWRHLPLPVTRKLGPALLRLFP